MQKIKCRTAFNARDEESVGITFPDETMTQQHFADECNINKIVDRYVKTGIIDHVSANSPEFADVSTIPDNLLECYRAVENAEIAFGSLPSALRKELDNDPANLVEWLQNPDNKGKAADFGLLLKSEQITITNDVKEKQPEAATDKA